MYELRDYARMAADRQRLDAYFRALDKTVRPGQVVVDIGSGTGLFALHACGLGARKVYALEPNPVVHLARELGECNGFAQQIEFIQKDSQQAGLPELADIIVSDLRGVLPLHSTHLPAIIDARKRFLRPGGKLIPQRDTLYAALVDAPEIYARYSDCWSSPGLDLEPARRMGVNDWGRGSVTPDQIVAPPQSWCTLNYAALHSCNAHGDLSWRIERSTTAHGLSVWYVAELADGVSFSTAPGEPETVSGMAFFPLLHPLELALADMVQVRIQATFQATEYIWGWTTEVRTSQGNVKARFEQCCLSGRAAGRDEIARRSQHHSPGLNHDGEISRTILSLMDGNRTVLQIAEELMRSFPQDYTSLEPALARVASLAADYSR